MIKIATPVSHLALDKDAFKDIIKASDCLEMRPGTLNISSNEEVYHCDSIQINHELTDDIINSVCDTINNAKKLKLVAFHCATNCSDPVLNGKKFMQRGLVYNHSEMIYNGTRNIEKIRKKISNHVELAVENNNYYETEWANPYDIVTDANFLNEFVNETNIGFLFDVSHAKVTCFNKKINYDEYVRQLPMHKLKQIQLCQYSIIDNECVDLHEKPNASTILHSIALALKYGCDYLTIEYYKNHFDLLDSINYMRNALNARVNL